jgi:fructose-bisphosphate aldolase class I
MNIDTLIKTAEALMADNKGLLAMDESNSTCNKRFAQYGIPQTVEARRDYRELLILTPRLNKFISGAILSDETIRQDAKDGNAFTKILDNLRIIYEYVWQNMFN